MRARRCAGHDRGNLDLHAAYLAQVGIAGSPGAAAADRDCVGRACGADLHGRMPAAVRFDDAFLVGQFAVRVGDEDSGGPAGRWLRAPAWRSSSGPSLAVKFYHRE